MAWARNKVDIRTEDEVLVVDRLKEKILEHVSEETLVKALQVAEGCLIK